MAQRGSGTRRELLVRWKGYGSEHDQWKSRAELSKTAAAVIQSMTHCNKAEHRLSDS